MINFYQLGSQAALETLDKQAGLFGRIGNMFRGNKNSVTMGTGQQPGTGAGTGTGAAGTNASATPQPKKEPSNRDLMRGMGL